MTELEIRAMLVDALDSAAILAPEDENLKSVFLSGCRDISLQELELDSLAGMELCIAIEVITGVSVVPGELAGIGTMDRLVKHVQELLA